MTVKDHLAFYLEHGISPVHQDITDLRRHLERRGSLYRRLGMPAMAFEGRTVLEVGPGSGHNSLYVAGCGPARLDLVEPNPVGAREIAERYAGFEAPHATPRVIHERLEDFSAGNVYDVAIAEAWIGATPNERRLMRKLADCVRPGGVLIVTLTSPIGILANLLRRLLGYRLMEDARSLAARTAILQQAFGVHLSTLEAMSRPHEDWIHDSLLNPAALTACLTPEPFFGLLPDFTVFESFPRFATDWRWYKALYGDGRRFNEAFLESYDRECHNQYDYRVVLPPQNPGDNRALEADCMTLVDLVIAGEAAGMPPRENTVIPIVHGIRDRMAATSADWAEGIEEFLTLYTAADITPPAVAAMKHFAPVFGRELIYISMIRDQ